MATWILYVCLKAVGQLDAFFCIQGSNLSVMSLREDIIQLALKVLNK